MTPIRVHPRSHPEKRRGKKLMFLTRVHSKSWKPNQVKAEIKERPILSDSKS
jgi:hypothetical protein